MKNKIITIYDLMGLIKDGKAPKQIKIGDDIWYFVKRYDGNYYIDKEEYCFHCCQLGFDYYIENNLLNNTVEILPEENDEWKDIEKINVDKENCKRFIEYDSETGHHKYTIRLLDEYFSNKINQLIKNQKYLKEKLESKDER